MTKTIWMRFILIIPGDSQNAGGLFNPIYIYNNSARGRTFIVSFEYKY